MGTKENKKSLYELFYGTSFNQMTTLKDSGSVTVNVSNPDSYAAKGFRRLVLFNTSYPFMVVTKDADKETATGKALTTVDGKKHFDKIYSVGKKKHEPNIVLA